MAFAHDNWPLILVMLASGAMLLWPMVGRRFSSAREISALEATRLINSEDAMLLDVRESKEYENERVANAMHVPLSQIAGRAKEFTRYLKRPVIAYCERGNRSRLAERALAKLGFKSVYLLRGGLRAWKEAGLPVEKVKGAAR